MLHELKEEHEIIVSRQAINQFLFHYKQNHSLVRKVGSGKPSKITPAILHAVEAKMQANDETTAVQLLNLLNRCGIRISLKRSRRVDISWFQILSANT